MKDCIRHVRSFAKVAIVYLTDASNFMSPNKHLYASLCATICMSRFGLPVVNVISKADLLDEERLESILCNDGIVEGDIEMDDKIEMNEYKNLTRTITEYVEHNGMLDYLPCNWDNDQMIENILMQLDSILQRHDDIEPRESRDE